MSSLYNEAIIGAAGQSSGYEIEQSLRFNSSDTAHFNRTPSSVGARQTWTYSVWVKGSDFSGDANTILSGGNYAYGTYLWFRDGGHIALGRYYSGSYTFLVEADGFYRDPTAWYHIVCVFDSGQATASDRVKLYVNGEQITSFITASYPSQHFETDINNDGIQWIGERGYDSALKLHGYMAEAHLVDGTALDPTSFGEYDNNGVWRPIQVSLTGPNDGTTWSDYLTDSNGAFESSYGATKAFNGTTDSANTARATTTNTTTTFEPPTDIPYTSSVEVWTYYGGSVSLNGGSSVSVSNDQFWRTIATGSGSLDTLTFTSSNSYVYLGAIRIDGVILIDGNTHQYGKNGFYLKFDPTATNGIGHDHSGNGNNWTPNNFTTSGTGTDVMSDTPTTNWCTLNPLRPSSYGTLSLSDGNLNASRNTTSYGSITTTIGVSSGKWYWEVYCNSIGFVTSIGITENLTANGPGSSGSYTYHYDGKKYVNGSLQNYSGNSYTSGDLLGFALDMDAGTLVAYKNGTSQGTLQTGLSGTFYPFVTLYGTHNVTFNFGQRAFEQTVPTGYKALNTSNLPAPEIKDGSDYFTTLAYSGTSTTDSKVIEDSQGNDWAPDFVWLKKRNSGANHMLYDRVRGASKSLRSNTTGGEVTGATNGDLTAFTPSGFTLNSGNDVNASGNTYVAWNWLAGGSGSSIATGSIDGTNPTIASTVSANPTAGFSIGTFTGTGTAGTIAHGLGNAPKFILIKRTNVSGNSWAVYHDSLGAGKQILLNSTNGVSNDASGFSSAPTSSVINVGTGSAMDTNQVGAHVFYAWAEVEGYSKFGSYTGNGSADGPFIATSFLPAWIMTKNSSTGGAGYDWYIFDSERNTYNPVGVRVKANASDAETSTTAIDLLSNGFKIRTSDSSWNRSGDTFVYMCFAENPFGGSGVSAATAR